MLTTNLQLGTNLNAGAKGYSVTRKTDVTADIKVTTL